MWRAPQAFVPCVSAPLGQPATPCTQAVGSRERAAVDGKGSWLADGHGSHPLFPGYGVQSPQYGMWGHEVTRVPFEDATSWTHWEDSFTPCPASVCCTALGLTKETVTESEAVKVNGLAISGTEPVTGAEQWLARQKSLDSTRQVCRGNTRGAEVTAFGGCEGATAPWQGLGLLLLRNLVELLGTNHQANKMCPSPTTERQVIRRNGVSAINAINHSKEQFCCRILPHPEASRSPGRSYKTIRVSRN